MRTLVVGDTHGCLEELQIMLGDANLNLSQDRLILLGDYIDRGPHSYDLLQFLKNLQHTHGEDKVVLLRGNHEQMAIDCGNYRGGWRTAHDFAERRGNIKSEIEFFKSLPLFFADDHFIYVHAGLKPGVNLEEQSASHLLWIRDEFYQSSFDFGRTVIFGHTPTFIINGQSSPLKLGNKIALDTGCVYGYFLSGLEISEGVINRVYQVPAVNHRSRKIA
jgi:serine/threonine protein phosphatase 1